MSSTTLRDIENQLRRTPSLLLRKDWLHLKKQLGRIKKAPAAERELLATQACTYYDGAIARYEARQQLRPPIRLNDSLPVAAEAEKIAGLIRQHQVVIVAGETGSGKTTQLPLIALQAGRGSAGLIGHTQPRRIAASSVAQRIADELGEPLGKTVSFKVRFLEKSAPESFVKLMTDGILLAELRKDPLLNQYDTLIIDEAHERSLNIDFLLGYLKLVLPRRPDLKVIITSATIDVERFSEFFGDAPIVTVEGRTYPVETRYRPLLDHFVAGSDDDDIDDFEERLPRAVVSAVEECLEDAKARGIQQQADILIFASTEQEIRELQNVLEKYGPRHTRVLPLFARQSIQDQQRIFDTRSTGRRIIISTNVAETSLTVPNIYYVIDTGFARLSRYSVRSRVQRLPIEAISQASANQRKGRCGRISPGVCIRLYGEDDFLQRPLFTDPEILRTNLASVILQMASLNLGAIEDFPFLDRPEGRYISDAVKRLTELGALEEVRPEGQGVIHHQITPTGRKMASLPIDPMLARMLLEASQRGALTEVLVIVSALAVQDIRERPLDRQTQADQKHALFRDDDSDFLFFWKVWQALRPDGQKMTDREKRNFAKNHFFSALRIREWERLYEQLREYTRQLGLTFNTEPASYAEIHQSLLTGLLAHIGHCQEPENQYLLPRQHKAKIFPGSTLARSRARWVMAFELLETSRTWLRLVAKIEPEWVIPAAGDLLKYHYHEPHWSRKTGTVNAYAQISLWGLILENRQRVRFDTVDLPASRQVFIQSALVEGKLGTTPAFLEKNLQLLGQLEEAEHLLRRKDLLPLEQELYAFYDRQLPAHVATRKSFLDWYNSGSAMIDSQLDFDGQTFIAHTGEALDTLQQLARTERFGQLELPVEFYFDPSTEHDGYFVDLPAIAISQVNEGDFLWGVGLWRQELVQCLLQSLPKHLRKQLLPLAPAVTQLLPQLSPDKKGSLPAQLAAAIFSTRGVRIAAEDFNSSSLPAYLRPTLRIRDLNQQIIAQGKDFTALAGLPAVIQAGTVMQQQMIAVSVPASALNKQPAPVQQNAIKPGKPDYSPPPNVPGGKTNSKKGAAGQGLQAAPAVLPATTMPQQSYDDFPEHFVFEQQQLVNGVSIRQFQYLIVTGTEKGAAELPLFGIATTHDEARAAALHRQGVILLLARQLRSQTKHFDRLFDARKMIVFQAYGDHKTLVRHALQAVIDTILYRENIAVPVSTAAFNSVLKQIEASLSPTAALLVQTLNEILQLLGQVKGQLNMLEGPFSRARDDMLDQLDALLFDRMLTDIPYVTWKAYPRYLQGMLKRLERLSNNLGRDDSGLDVIDAYMTELMTAPGQYIDQAARWALEELRIQLFAQPMKTAINISPKKLDQLWQARQPAAI